MSGTTSEPVGFYDIAHADPSRPAIVEPERRSLTFGELLGRCNALANMLLDWGLEAGDAVAARVGNRAEYFEILLAAGQVGLRFVPVNTHLVVPEIEYILADSGAKAFVCDDAEAAVALRDELAPCRLAIGRQPIGWRPYEEFVGAGSASPPPDRVAGEVMGYTSGTSGRPKGVWRPLSGATPEQAAARSTALLKSMNFSTAGGRHLVCSPLYHAAPWRFSSGALHLGHTLILHRRFDGEAVLRDVEKFAITTSHMVPTHFHRLLSLPPRARARADVGSLISLVHAAAPCPVHIKRAMIDWVGPVLWEYLAATEGMVSVVGSAEWLRHPGTVGRPYGDTRVKIIGDDGREMRRGEAGTIFFASTSGPFEYHNDPAKTAASRRDDMVTVGDIGRMDAQGYLYILDRRDDLIISGGVNIYPAAIEAHLLAHPDVADAAVIGQPDTEWGQRVIAVIQPRHGVGRAIVDRLMLHCTDGLAAYKRPKEIRVVDTMPRTEAGKLLRRELRERYGPTAIAGTPDNRSEVTAR